MKKNKLTANLIENTFDFYKKNFGKVFSDTESKKLSSKLLEIVEYDHIIKDKKLSYNLPQNTLFLIYFIGEYKKAYQYAIQNKKDKDKNTLEALGKGFTNKEKAYEEGLGKIFDESLDSNDQVKSLVKSSLLLLLKKPSYKKVSMLILGSIYSNYALIKKLLNNIYRYNPTIQIFLDSTDYTLKYFEYTHVAETKILNSSLIIIYTVLNNNLKIDENEAFKYAKELVNTFIDSKEYMTDKYRKSYITDKEIYYAAIYQGLPIFQWHISTKNKPYYTDEDLFKLKVIMRIFRSEDDNGFLSNYLFGSLLKTFSKKVSSKDILDSKNMLDDNEKIRKWLRVSYKQFAIAPFPLLMYLPEKKSLILSTISIFIGGYTKLTSLKTKFSKK